MTTCKDTHVSSWSKTLSSVVDQDKLDDLLFGAIFSRRRMQDTNSTTGKVEDKPRDSAKKDGPYSIFEGVGISACSSYYQGTQTNATMMDFVEYNDIGITCDTDLATVSEFQAAAPGTTGTIRDVCCTACAWLDHEFDGWARGLPAGATPAPTPAPTPASSAAFCSPDLAGKNCASCYQGGGCALCKEGYRYLNLESGPCHAWGS